MTDPLGLPENCGRPRLVLRCTECDAWASWIVPCPKMRGLIIELATKAGWTGITVGPCRCGDCQGVEPKAGPGTKVAGRRRPRLKYLPGQRVYSDELVAEVWRLRDAGGSWRKIACHVERMTGRDVSASTICWVAKYHRRRAERLAAEQQQRRAA